MSSVAPSLEPGQARVEVDSANNPTSSSVFQDGRSVDFVLVWLEELATTGNDAAKKRETFEKNLEKEGLLIEREQEGLLHFVKIHAPPEVLKRYMEILKLRIPLRESYIQKEPQESSSDTMEGMKTPVKSCMDWKTLVKHFKDWVHVDPEMFPPQKHRLTAEFSRNRLYLFFENKEAEKFSAADRTAVVDFILEHTRFSEDETVGIKHLKSDGTYKAAYPLHDGDYRKPGSVRYSLNEEWASLRKWMKYQPLDYIKDYFGVKFGLYFAWLGFYILMLIPAALVGLICFIYGWATMYSNTLSEDICNLKIEPMCPLCDKCPYWNLTEACSYSRATYIFDNPSTVFFAFFMSFWGTLFLELWKRYSADITHHWGLTGFDVQAEHPRPEYLARLKNAKRRLNVVTRKKEPYVPFWRVRVPVTLFSYSVVFMLIIVVIAAVFGVVLYRIAMLGSKLLSDESQPIFTSVSAAVINLVCIMLLNYLYEWLALKLTEMELLRTQTEFDDSFTLKIYLFQFVNYYTSIFYIAFLKGKFVGYPSKYNRILNFRQEECSPGGCLIELCIQLGIIMTGKQLVDTVQEMIIPLASKTWNRFKLKVVAARRKSGSLINQQTEDHKQWAEDYNLLDWGPRELFPEYLEMVLQYGFITIFVAAFPLAPFFALLNNVLEMRLDAKKFLQLYRRPVPRRVKNIGVWFRILDILGRISVVTNAFIIAFSSNFIPRLVYTMTVNPDHTDVGFLNHSLAYFNTSDFEVPNEARDPHVELCRYPKYRNPPWDQSPYKRSMIYWHILAARLAFVVVFQNLVGFVMVAVRWLIPDIPKRVRNKIYKEAYFINEIIIKEERERAKNTGST